MKKTEPWFVRLTVEGFMKADRLMADFGIRSRDVLALQAMQTLAAVKSGNDLPDCIDEARQRHVKILLQRVGKVQDHAESRLETRKGQAGVTKTGGNSASGGGDGCDAGNDSGRDRKASQT